MVSTWNVEISKRLKRNWSSPQGITYSVATSAFKQYFVRPTSFSLVNLHKHLLGAAPKFSHGAEVL